MTHLGFRRIWLALAAFIALWIAPAEAQARWLRAESPRFIIYSDGDEQTLRRNIRELENFDRMLRGIHGLPLDGLPTRKLEVYLVRSDREIELLRPGWGEVVAGYYSAGSEDIYAVGLRERRGSHVLLHEYVHHFMLQNLNRAYPGWLVEGYAEYFGASEFDEDGLTFGMPLSRRGYTLLHGDWLPLDQVVGGARPRRETMQTMDAYYAQSWAITHWFMGDPARRARLFRYIAEIGRGADLMEAFNRATEMPPEEFQRTLRRYVGGRLSFSQAPASSFPPVEITVTTLPPSADGLLLLNQRQKAGLEEDEREDTLRLIRQRAAAYPDDNFALLVLGHAELHIGDAVEGERLLNRLLQFDPESVEALQLLASRRYTQAEEAEVNADRVRLLNEGNRFLARALEIDPDDYRTYYWLALNRQGEPSYPNDNDIATWEAAFELAPQLSETRFGLGRALMLAERYDYAIDILMPLANAPHGGESRDYAAQLVLLAAERRAPISFSAFQGEGETGETTPSSEPETPEPEE